MLRIYTYIFLSWSPILTTCTYVDMWSHLFNVHPFCGSHYSTQSSWWVYFLPLIVWPTTYPIANSAHPFYGSTIVWVQGYMLYHALLVGGILR